MATRPSTPRGRSVPSSATRTGARAGRRSSHQRNAIEPTGVPQDRRFGQFEHGAPWSPGGGCVEDRVDGTASRLVGAFHRRQVRVRPHVVGGQHQVGDPRRRLRSVVPRSGGVDQQRLEVGRLGGIGELDRRIEEPGHHPRLVEDRHGSVVEVVGELSPDLGPDLVAAASRGHLAGAASRCLPVGDVDGEDAPNAAVAVTADVHAVARTGPARWTSAPTPSRCRSCARGRRGRRCRGRTARRSSTG